MRRAPRAWRDRPSGVEPVPAGSEVTVMNQRFGFVRVTCASPMTAVANPDANADAMIEVLRAVPDSDCVLFPELGVTAYTCADLFGQTALLEAGVEATLRIVGATAGREQLVVVGLPVAVRNSLYNCGV